MACHPCLEPFSFRSLFFQSQLFHKKSKLFGFKLELNHWKKRFDDQIKKKHKILNNSSTVMYEKMNNGALHDKNLTRIVLN
jgi:hypothetical protein